MSELTPTIPKDRAWCLLWVDAESVADMSDAIACRLVPVAEWDARTARIAELEAALGDALEYARHSEGCDGEDPARRCRCRWREIGPQLHALSTPSPVPAVPPVAAGRAVAAGGDPARAAGVTTDDLPDHKEIS